MEWLVLLLAGIVYTFSAYLSYNEEWKKHWSYYPTGIFFGILVSILWYYLAKHIPEKNRIYFYSLVWDTIMIFVFYFTPILFYGVTLNKANLIGLALIILGLMVFKLGN